MLASRRTPVSDHRFLTRCVKGVPSRSVTIASNHSILRYLLRNLRALVAGTRVVRAPRVVMWPDLAEPHASVRRPFLDIHLKVYGEAELAALERLLRMDARLPGHQATLVELSRLVRARTGWSHDERPEDAEPFLRDFYAAQRRHLEDRLRRGDRKRDKHDGS